MQAVTYFQRAIKLDRKYLNAWTLMGHEYVEMKNPTGAIGAPVPPQPLEALPSLWVHIKSGAHGWR